MLYIAFSVPLIICRWKNSNFLVLLFFLIAASWYLKEDRHSRGCKVCKESASCFSNTHEFGKSAVLHSVEIPTVQLCWPYLWESQTEMQVTLLPKDSDLNITLFFFCLVAFFKEVKKSKIIWLHLKELVRSRMELLTVHTKECLAISNEQVTSVMSCNSTWTFRVSF